MAQRCESCGLFGLSRTAAAWRPMGPACNLRSGRAHGMGAISGGEQQGGGGSGCGSSTDDQGSLFGDVKAVAAGRSAFGRLVASGLVRIRTGGLLAFLQDGCGGAIVNLQSAFAGRDLNETVGIRNLEFGGALGQGGDSQLAGTDR